MDHDSFLPGLTKLCEAIHKHGACAMVQLNHAGASASSARIGMQPISASDLPSKPGGEIPRPMTEEEMQTIAAKDLGHSEIVNHDDPAFVKFIYNLH